MYNHIEDKKTNKKFAVSLNYRNPIINEEEIENVIKKDFRFKVLAFNDGKKSRTTWILEGTRGLMTEFIGWIVSTYGDCLVKIEFEDENNRLVY